MGVEPNYVDKIAVAIESAAENIPLPNGDRTALFRLYALLALTKGSGVTAKDVHDAWSVWMTAQDPTHESILPFQDLSDSVRDEDLAFSSAIHSVVETLLLDGPGQFRLGEDALDLKLFPSGRHGTAESDVFYDQYKLMVESSEALVARRQGVNTFFLTVNGALLTAIGLIVQTGGEPRLVALSIAVLAAAGAILGLSWRSLLLSFGQLNTGKFKVIQRLEDFLPAAIYTAEWRALDEGKNPEIYRSFTSREVWAPITLTTVFAGVSLVGAVVAIVKW